MLATLVNHLHVELSEQEIIALERGAYHGGRVECFRFGKKKEQ